MWRGVNVCEFCVRRFWREGEEVEGGGGGGGGGCWSEVEPGVVLRSSLMLAGVSGKGVEMRVMRVGRTIDRAVWLAKHGGECQKLDPEIMAGIQSCKCKICTITYRSSRPLGAS
ncbi:hypothetical protein M758_1G238000 [Ceratodon purpureus]|nr:hypothetical protein M758_1G238000 [Ceratodon purpureus]